MTGQASFTNNAKDRLARSLERRERERDGKGTVYEPEYSAIESVTL